MNHDLDNPQERDERLRGLISKGAELAGGAAGPAVGMVIGSFLAGPAGAAVGGLGRRSQLRFEKIPPGAKLTRPQARCYHPVTLALMGAG